MWDSSANLEKGRPNEISNKSFILPVPVRVLAAWIKYSMNTHTTTWTELRSFLRPYEISINWDSSVNLDEGSSKIWQDRLPVVWDPSANLDEAGSNGKIWHDHLPVVWDPSANLDEAGSSGKIWQDRLPVVWDPSANLDEAGSSGKIWQDRLPVVWDPCESRRGQQ
jgi:hypothetical protein